MGNLWLVFSYDYCTTNINFRNNINSELPIIKCSNTHFSQLPIFGNHNQNRNPYL
jgi:hypothetical protein